MDFYVQIIYKKNLPDSLKEVSLPIQLEEL